jgi:hypothetical protein
MDTLTTQVLLRCMLTNSRKASVSIVAGTVLKREDNTRSQYSLVGLQSESSSVGARSESS